MQVEGDDPALKVEGDEPVLQVEGDDPVLQVEGGAPGEENGTPLQYSFLENPRDGRAWCVGEDS